MTVINSDPNQQDGKSFPSLSHQLARHRVMLNPFPNWGTISTSRIITEPPGPFWGKVPPLNKVMNEVC